MRIEKAIQYPQGIKQPHWLPDHQPLYQLKLAHVPVLLIRFLFFGLIPLGIYLLVIGIGLVRRQFNGKLILEVSFASGGADFSLSKSGHYAIWQKGLLFRRTPVTLFQPVIVQRPNHQAVPLSPSLSRAQSNDGFQARMELFTFWAMAGDYTLEIREGSSVSGLEKAVSRLLPLKQAAPGQYFIQVREDPQGYGMLAGIPLILLSAFCIIGGLVVGILAPQIFG